MSCTKMENRILGYVDGRLKESERLEVEKHLSTCAACQLRVNEFRAVSGLLDELPVIEPSPAFDVRVRARVAAEPAKQSWWASLMPSPRVAFAASMLVLAIVWLGMKPGAPALDVKSTDDLAVLENYDMLSNFSPLSELPPPASQGDEVQQQNGAPQDQNQQDATQPDQTI